MKKQMKLKRYILTGVALIFVVSGSVFGYNWYRDAQRPFYDHGQCEARFDVCEPDILKYAEKDLTEVQNYFNKRYGLAANQVDIIGTTLRIQGLESMRVYTFRVEVMKGYSFTFSKTSLKTAPHLDGFGYDYVKELDDTQGMIAGLFYEMKHGKDYSEIKEILEKEDLLYLADDYKYNRTIRLMYEGDILSGNLYNPIVFENEVASKIKNYVNKQTEENLKVIMTDIENREWKKRLIVIPYVKDKKKYETDSATWKTSSQDNTEWAINLQNEIKKRTPNYDKIRVSLHPYKDETAVKKWK